MRITTRCGLERGKPGVITASIRNTNVKTREKDRSITYELCQWLYYV